MVRTTVPVLLSVVLVALVAGCTKAAAQSVNDGCDAVLLLAGRETRTLYQQQISQYTTLEQFGSLASQSAQKNQSGNLSFPVQGGVVSVGATSGMSSDSVDFLTSTKQVEEYTLDTVKSFLSTVYPPAVEAWTTCKAGGSGGLKLTPESSLTGMVGIKVSFQAETGSVNVLGAMDGMRCSGTLQDDVLADGTGKIAVGQPKTAICKREPENRRFECGGTTHTYVHYREAKLLLQPDHGKAGTLLLRASPDLVCEPPPPPACADRQQGDTRILTVLQDRVDRSCDPCNNCTRGESWRTGTSAFEGACVIAAKEKAKTVILGYDCSNTPSRSGVTVMSYRAPDGAERTVELIEDCASLRKIFGPEVSCQ
jgi:hypothetical protein